MSELLKSVLSLSLSGTLLFFIILALKPLYKNKLSKNWQYYVWLIVVVRMLIPFAPETTLVGSAFEYLDNINVGTIQTPPPAHDTPSDFTSADSIPPSAEPQAPKSTIDTAPSISIQAIFSKVYENLWLLWAAIAFASLIRKITMYQSFVRFVKAGRAEVSDIEILNMLADVGETIGVKRPVELFTNPLISSPMLLGFFRPYIILPSIELESTELAYIMRHELTHYKHLDMFYKWLVQITVCLHWFNPFAYLLAKEINKCCELSCDEAIIRTMDKDEKKAYGDTLLNSLKAIGNYNDKLATVTLTEGAEQLKERLDAIMKFKKASKITVTIMLVFTLVLSVGATAIGAYAVTPTPVSNNSNTNFNSAAPSGTAKSVSALQDVTADNAKSISISATSCGIELVKSENDKFTFDYLGVENSSKFKVTANSKGDALEIVVDGTAARAAAGHYYIDDGANPVNVVRIGIPDREYQTLTMELMEAPISLPDFNAAIIIKSEDGTISISDKDISKGSYNITNTSGGVSITANTVLSNVSIENQGECEITFHQMPQNLGLDLSACQGQIVLPDGWTKTQTLGDGTPIIKISNQGYTEIIVNENVESRAEFSNPPINTSTTNDFFGTDWDEKWNEFDKAFSNPKNYSAPNTSDVKLINTKQWDTDGIKEIDATYITDDIKLLTSSSDEIVLKEYLSEDAPSYYANTSIVGSALKISRGERPAPSATGYISIIEIYVPTDFNGIVKLSTDSGCVDISNYKGNVNCVTETGLITVSDSVISGTFNSDNGNIELGIDNILGNVKAHSQTGDVIANISTSASFSIKATTDTGEVINDFSDSLTSSNKVVSGEWGTNPINKVIISSDSGNVKINQK